MSQNDNELPSADEKRDTIGYWLKWVKAAKENKERERHRKDAESAYREYELGDRPKESDELLPARGYNIYAESCWTLEPEYFAQNPTIASRRRHGIENEMALTMCLIVDRLGQHLVDNGNFYETMEAFCGDFMHASKAANQVVYSATKKTQRVPLTQDEVNPELYMTNGEPYSGEVMKDGEGYYGEQQTVNEDTQRIFIAPLPFDEVIHTPMAKTPIDITDIGYKFCLDYETAEKKFNTGPDGNSLGRSLPYVTSEDKDDKDQESSAYKHLYGYEIYSCDPSKKVYWVCEGFKEDFLMPPQVDPYGLKGFFPSTKFVIKNKRRKSLYPTPTWRYLEATANQIHELYQRVFDLIGCIERRALVYGASPELITLLNNGKSGNFVAVAQSADILEKGGANKMIEWIDVNELVSAITECLTLEQHFGDRFAQAFGIPDVLKGISDPSETAEAQGIKADAGHNRFKKDKHKIINAARDSAEMMLDLALRVFSDEKIMRICGYEHLEEGTPPQPPTPENPEGIPGKPSHKERFGEALARLRNDTERIVTIDFETDSTNFRDEERDIQRATMISNTVLQGLAALGGMQNFEFMNTALTLLLVTLDAMGGSTKSENMIKKAVDELEKKKNAPPPPPPPDVEMLKVELKSREITLKEQIAISDKARQDFEAKLEEVKAASTAQLEQVKISLEQQVEGMRIALENKDLQIQDAKREGDQAVKVKDLQLREVELERTSELDAIRLASEQRINELTLSLEAEKVNNDRIRVQQEEVLSKLRIMETFMEEQRLNREHSERREDARASAAPPINLTFEMPKPGKRVGKIVQADGSIVHVESEEA